jgi:branched-chain amino acid transport system substrate-binding protein
MYSAALETPANRKFVADYRKKYGKVPSCFAETCYTSARWISEAARQVGATCTTATIRPARPARKGPC